MKKSILLPISAAIICLFHIEHVYSSVELDNHIIPSALVTVLKSGVNIPVYVNYNGSTDNDYKSLQKIAEANISLDDEDKIRINSINVLDSDDASAKLSDNLANTLDELKDKYFNEKSIISINDSSTLSINISSFTLILSTNENGFSAKEKEREFTLGESSSKNVSSVTTYNLGAYQNINQNSKNNSNSFLNFESIVSLAEKHLNLQGSYYGLGKSSGEFTLYNAMLERDYQGLRVAAGLLNTWNMQSIASMSALSSSKLYAVTIGNNSSTQKVNSQLSLTPINVFLSSPGEIRIYRQNKLISIQNFPMGSFEVDTSTLPYGIYDVTVETVIDGNITTKQIETINKSFGSISQLNKLNWEVYAGYVKNENNNYYNGELKSDTYVIGVSGATSLNVANGMNLTMSNYSFDNYLVQETGVQLQLIENLSVSIQTLLVNTGSYRVISNTSVGLPNGYASLWAGYQKSKIKDDLPLYDEDNYSYGGTFDINKIVNNAGTVSVYRNIDNKYNTRSTNVDYYNRVYSSRYVNISMRTGFRNYVNNNSENKKDKYISLDFAMPLSSWFSTGLSTSDGTTKVNIAANKSFENSFINSAGLNASKAVSGSDNYDDYSIGGYASYDAKYSSGNININRTGNEQTSLNLTSTGTLAYGDGSFGLSGNRGNAGVILKTEMDGGELTARVNGMQYPVTGKSTLIPLTPYGTYQIELMNDNNSKSSFNISSNKIKKVTLYPGNIITYKADVKQMVTVFGRITNDSGSALKYAKIKNHIGMSTTDDNGQFSMDVDKRYPIITLYTDESSHVCEADLDLSGNSSALWLGDIICSSQKSLAQR